MIYKNKIKNKIKEILNIKPDRQLRKIEKKLNKILRKKYNQFEKLSIISNIATIVNSIQRIETYTDGKKEYKIVNCDFEMSSLIADKTFILGKIRKWKDERVPLIPNIKIENNPSDLWMINQDIIKKMELITEIIAHEYFKFQEKLVYSSSVQGKSLIFQLRKKPTISLYRCVYDYQKEKGILIASDMRCNVGNVSWENNIEKYHQKD